MKVLWLCNLILPEIASDLGLASLPKEGWVKGLFDSISVSEKVKIILAFPMAKEVIKRIGGPSAAKKGFHKGIIELANKELEYFVFYENTTKEYEYDVALENEMRGILEECKPDLVHIFGAEFPHALAMAKAINNPDKLLIGLQGLCSEIANRYAAHLPYDVVVRHTFRDLIKKDSIYEGQQKYFKRGENEQEALKLAGHIAGRTAFDKGFAYSINPNAKYHHAGENLRKEFYSGAWDKKASEKYRIFVSQADYPLKGFHYLLLAVGEIMREAGKTEDTKDIQIYVAGQSLVSFSNIKDRIKISSYGKYLRSLIDEYNLVDRVHILGRLSAKEMKEQYLKCDTYVCCSSCENSPNSLGEAMMLQVPIVTAEVGGILSVFNKGEDGYSYRNELEDRLGEVALALKNALLTRWNDSYSKDSLNSDYSEVDRRRHNAGFHARENHNLEKNAIEMIKIYESMI